MTQLAAPAPTIRSAGRLPAPIRAAVFLWVACALLGLLNAGLGFVLAAAGQPVNASQRDPVGVAIGIVFAVLVLVLALQTAMGRATGTRGAGAASLFLALLYAGFACLSGLMTASGEDWGGAEKGLYAAAGLMGVQAVILLAAGFLARWGHRAYLTWRTASTAPAGG